MEWISEFMIPVILGICLCTGYVIKKWIRDIDNKSIPTILAVTGVILAAWIHGWTVTPEVVLSGLVSGLSSTGMHQLFTQFIEQNNQV